MVYSELFAFSKVEEWLQEGHNVDENEYQHYEEPQAQEVSSLTQATDQSLYHTEDQNDTETDTDREVVTCEWLMIWGVLALRDDFSLWHKLDCVNGSAV